MTGPTPSCTIHIRVRYAETDAMGFLHHARYFVYFEEGRTELLRRNGVRYRDLEEMGVLYVVAKLECRFKAPARYDDVVSLTTTTERLSPVLVEHSYRLMRDDVVLADAKSTLVAINREGKPAPLPDDVFARLSGEAPPGAISTGS